MYVTFTVSQSRGVGVPRDNWVHIQDHWEKPACGACGCFPGDGPREAIRTNLGARL